MEITDTVVAVFPAHDVAETAVKKLTAAGFEMKNLSIVGKGYKTEEKVVGFYGTGDRVKFWGSRVIDWTNRLVALDIDRQRIKDSPEYDPSVTIHQADGETFLTYYGIKWIKDDHPH